ncbi:DUF3349 domain-containing protein [Mycobacterium paraterrae]|uniref:DUF3349 domain-containing protein n=1 Tax=Mycobacterium paraterrae TaxID=577492 RepID=A0ABY3VQI0_9MYCO|nr:DUF3349 domain-containing protein [Mycobacterium paraterrae]UMB69452.1 DUF3349 domain-containing protein [Mycobacterium paraterrae]
MLMTRLLAPIVGFLRAGYPIGIVERGVERGYVPLLALCRRRLSDDEVSLVAGTLMVTGASPIDRADVQVAITKLVDDLPSLEDAERVNKRIAAAGCAVTDSFPRPDENR